MRTPGPLECAQHPLQSIRLSPETLRCGDVFERRERDVGGDTRFGEEDRCSCRVVNGRGEWRRGEAGCDVLALLYFGCLHTNVIDVYV